ncbi:MAG: FAD-binding protein, partial [Chloroflexota bacterium]
MATDFDVIEADVLIIGAGIAGCRAALEAVNHGARVVMTTKGLFGRDGSATWMATLAFQCWGVHPDDPLDRHVDDTLRCGWFLNNQENVYAFLSHLPDAARELMDWGVRFRQENGQVATVWQLGQSIAEGRSFTAAQWPRGELCYNLSRAIPPVVKGRPIQIVEDIFIVDLVKNDGAVVGALGIDVRSGRFRLFQARTTILATGGYQGLYNFTTANPNLTGDGQAMALRAGADMTDFEFNQTLPCAIWPPQLAGDILPFDLILHYGGRMYNSDNERIISKWDPVNMERSSRAIIS